MIFRTDCDSFTPECDKSVKEFSSAVTVLISVYTSNYHVLVTVVTVFSTSMQKFRNSNTEEKEYRYICIESIKEKSEKLSQLSQHCVFYYMYCIYMTNKLSHFFHRLSQYCHKTQKKSNLPCFIPQGEVKSLQTIGIYRAEACTKKNRKLNGVLSHKYMKLHKTEREVM